MARRQASNARSAPARGDAPEAGPQTPKGPLIPLTESVVGRSTRILTDSQTDEPDYAYNPVIPGMSGGWV